MPKITFEQPKYVPSADGAGGVISFKIKPEKARLVGYFFFWTLVIFSVLISKIWVNPRIKAGAMDKPIEQRGCPPFDRVYAGPDWPAFSRFEGMDYGTPFDMSTTHLTDLFGFNNVCANWDYTPARESMAVYFVFFEYSMTIYMILNFINTAIAFKRGEIPGWYYSMAKAATPFLALFTITFRLIFVFIAYESPRGHTSGFLAFQMVLMWVALENSIFIILTGQTFGHFSRSTTLKMAWAYLIGCLVFGFMKVCVTAYYVLDISGEGHALAITLEPAIFSMYKGELLDRIWMIFFAVLPLYISYNRMQGEDPFTVEIVVPKRNYEGDSGETNSLVGS